MQLAFIKKLARVNPMRNESPMILSWRVWKGFSLIFLLILGCSTPRVSEISSQEVQQQEDSLGVALAKRFEGEIELVSDSQVSGYLEEIGNLLLSSAPFSNEGSVHIRIIKDLLERWVNYGFPKNQVYLSRTLLRSIKFENELAAAIALELAHLQKRDLMIRYEKVSREISSIQNGELFNFSADARTAALEMAMEMMYQAGFDPRGMVYLLSRYQENPGKSPYDEVLIKQLMENSWRVISLHAPLRNPIVRSDRFLTLYQRMQKL